MTESNFFVLVLCIFLCIACYYDYRFCRIPNGLIALVLVLGAGRALYLGGVLMLARYLLYGTLMTVTLYPLFKIGTIGGGDVKLFGVCCGFFPKDKILSFLFFSLLVAAILSVIRFIRKADFWERMSYLCAYVKEVADSGEWKLYWNDLREKKDAGICLAGPILISTLMFLGGLY